MRGAEKSRQMRKAGEGMKIAVCGESAKAQAVRRWLRDAPEGDHASVAVFSRGEQLLQAYRQQVYFDLIFLIRRRGDEQLPRLLREKDALARLVSLTDGAPVTGDARDACPLRAETVREVFARQRALFVRQGRELSLPVWDEEGEKNVLHFGLRDILYIESCQRQTCLRTIYERRYRCYSRLAALEERLAGHDFFRVHRGCLINLRYLRYVDASQVGLAVSEDGGLSLLPLSRRRRGGLRDALKL